MSSQILVGLVGNFGGQNFCFRASTFHAAIRQGIFGVKVNNFWKFFTADVIKEILINQKIYV